MTCMAITLPTCQQCQAPTQPYPSRCASCGVRNLVCATCGTEWFARASGGRMPSVCSNCKPRRWAADDLVVRRVHQLELMHREDQAIIADLYELEQTL